MPSPFPKPYETVQAGRATIRFFHGDSLQVLAELPERSVDVVVTSPPYNLGIQYRTYDDGKPQRDYLEWTGQWVAAAARALAAQGSLFLNVGAKPTEPWTALDVAQAAGRTCGCRTSCTGSSRLPSRRRPPAPAPG